MQVILRKSVQKLGFVGDVVNVAKGYYRNFLAPRDLAFVADEGSIKQGEHRKKIIESRKNKEKEESLELQKKIEANPLQFTHEAGTGDRLFGSVTAQDIAENLKAKGFNFDKKQILLDQPIKKIGDHTVEIKLHPDVKAAVRVEVMAKVKEVKKSSKKEAKEVSTTGSTI